MELELPLITCDIPKAAASAANCPILMVGNFLSGAGGNRSVCEDLAQHLSAAGWKVMSTSARQERAQRLADMLHTVWAKRNEYRVAQVDVFSGAAFFWAVAVCRLLRQLHKPYILTLHGGNLPAFSRRWPRLVRSVLGSAAAVTAPSGYLAEALREFRREIQVLPNAIPIAAYPFRHRRAAAPRLVWLRAFHRIYNPLLAVKALALLAGQFPEVRLTMVGPDKGDGTYKSVQSLATSLNVEDRIDFPGRVSKTDVGQWINRGDIFLNTSAVDNHPVTLLEAMACGACIVSTNAGGIPYIAQHGSNCLLVNEPEPRVFASHVAEILHNPQLAARLSQNARHTAEQYDWRMILPQWFALLSTIANKSS